MPVSFQPGMHRGDFLAGQRRRLGQQTPHPLGQIEYQPGMSAMDVATINRQRAAIGAGMPSLAAAGPVFANNINGYATMPGALPFRSRLGLNQQVGAALGGAPIQATPIGYSPRQNYPTNVAPDVPDASMPSVVPRYGQTNQQAQQSYVDAHQSARVNTHAGVAAMRNFQGGVGYGLVGVYTPRSGNQLRVSTQPDATVQVNGGAAHAGPTMQMLERQRAAAERRTDRSAARAINRAKMRGLPAATTPAVREAYVRLGIPVPGLSRSQNAAAVADYSPTYWRPQTAGIAAAIERARSEQAAALAESARRQAILNNRPANIGGELTPGRFVR